MTVPELSVTGYALIGFIVLALLSWLLGVLLPKLIGKTIDARFAKKEREDQEYRREQIEDAVRQQKGFQVMTDCLHEILNSQLTGNHKEDLIRCQKELEAFREENRAALMKKAAKYNLR